MSRLEKQSVWLKTALACLMLLISILGANAACVSTTVSTPGINFGAYSITKIMIAGTITLTCVGDGINSYAIALSTGGSNSYAMRRMNSGTKTLAYNLYADAAYTQIWGDGTGGSTLVSGSLSPQAGLLSSSVSHTVYGRVPDQPMPASGVYTDTIIVTVIY